LRKPEVVFQIVGSNPARAIRKLAQSAGIEVTGYVADVRPYLRKAAVCVVPLRVARGVQNKVLESMACGRPVVATPESVAGLDLTDGQELIVAGSPERFAESVIGIMEDAALSETLSLSARNFVEQRHAWKPLLQGMVEVVESVARRRTRSGSDLSNENTRKANR
jgi:glycosyltransferase involved in cell wall biosynthesis